VEFLLERRAAKLRAKKKGELKLDWRGTLRDLLELLLDQERANDHVVAERYGLTIVSFDGDFDRTERGRKTPIVR